MSIRPAETTADPRPDPSVDVRLGVIDNPRSGANLKAPDAIRRLLGAHPEIERRQACDPPSVAAALRELAGARVNTLAIAGGDGTVQAVLSVLFSAASPFAAPPRLAILHAGTTNMIAGDVGIRGTPQRALAALIEQTTGNAEGLATVQRPILRIDTGAERQPICGMYFGAAAILQGVEYCTRRMHRVGLRGEIGPGFTLLRFALEMARGRIAPTPVGVALDGVATGISPCWIVQVTTLERLFLGLRPFWGTESAALHFTQVRARPARWLRMLPGLLRGRPNRHLTPANGYVSHNAQRIDLHLDSRFLVDGEIFTPTPGLPVVLTRAGEAHFLRLRREAHGRRSHG